jgi:hypothetical protein
MGLSFEYLVDHKFKKTDISSYGRRWGILFVTIFYVFWRSLNDLMFKKYVKYDRKCDSKS